MKFTYRDRAPYTLSDLEQIIPLKIELDFLRESAERVSYCEADALRFKELIERRYGEYLSLVCFIDEVQDSMLRLMLRMKFIEGMTYQQIAFRIGKYDESYVRKAIKAFLAEERRLPAS